MQEIKPSVYPENRWPQGSRDFTGGRVHAELKLGTGRSLEVFLARLGNKGDSALFFGVLGKGCAIFDKKVKVKDVATVLKITVADAANVADYINSAIGQHSAPQELGQYVWKECAR